MFASVHLKFPIYFSIKTYFFILQHHFLKAHISVYLLYTPIYLNNNFYSFINISLAFIDISSYLMVSLSTPPLSLPTQLSASLIPKSKHSHMKATMADQAVAVTDLEIFPLGCHMDFSLSLVWFWFDFGLRWIFWWWLGGTLLLLLLLVGCFEMVVVVLVVWWFPSSSFGGFLWNRLWWS